MSPRPAEEVRLTLREKLSLLIFYAIVIAKTLLSALTWPITAPAKRSRLFRRHVANALVRHVFTHSSSRIEQAICPDTDELYRLWAKRTGAPPRQEVLPDGTSAFWFGPPTASTILLYFHGGGYHLPALPSHITFAARLATDLGPHNFSVLLLQYAAGPFGRYPTQLAQAAAMYAHLRATRPDATIVLGGDSAGANMVLALLSHMLHPHPDPVVPRLREGEKVEGALLVSPWVDPFDVAARGSMVRNGGKDLLARGFLQRWGQGWAEGREVDGYMCAGKAPEGWWEGVDRVCGRWGLVVGGDEVLLDQALGFAEGWKKGVWRGEGDVMVQADEGHIACVVDPENGMRVEEVRMYADVRDWLRKVVVAE